MEGRCGVHHDDRERAIDMPLQPASEGRCWSNVGQQTSHRIQRRANATVTTSELGSREIGISACCRLTIIMPPCIIVSS